MSYPFVLAALLGAALAAGPAWSKLPPMTDEAKAKAEAAAAKAALGAKQSAYALCEVQDRVVARYQAWARAAGKSTPAPVATPPCVRPGAAETVPQAAAATPAATSPAATSPAATAPAAKP